MNAFGKCEDLITKATINRGVNKLARELGCSRGHLSQVLLRKRGCSPWLKRKLLKIGVELPATAAGANCNP